MRIVLISDTHARHREVQLPEGDVLIHAGDICQSVNVPRSKRVQYNREVLQDFNAWLKGLDFKLKIVVAGNHDFLCQSSPGLTRSILSHGYYLQDEWVLHEGVRFYGSPWQPWFGGWAFNLEDEADARRVWSNIPFTTDVLITHGPPHGVLDVPHSNIHAGCPELRKVVDRVKPRLHVFGHIHAARGSVDIEGTAYRNVALVDNTYQIVHEPMVFDL